MRSLCVLATSVLLTFLGAVSAQAQIKLPFTAIDLLPNPSPITVNLTMSGSGSKSVLVRPFTISIAPYSSSAVWFCMDPFQTMYVDGPSGKGLDYGSTNPNDFDRWSAPGVASARIADLADLFTKYGPLTKANVKLDAAFQLAVWEIANETITAAQPTYSLAGGTFLASGSGTETTETLMLAQRMLGSLNSAGVQNVGKTSSLSFLIDGTYTSSNDGRVSTVAVQDLVGFISPIPEPAHFASGAVLGLGILVVLRRRQRGRGASK